jgi:hypothetical protein
LDSGFHQDRVQLGRLGQANLVATPDLPDDAFENRSSRIICQPLGKDRTQGRDQPLASIRQGIDVYRPAPLLPDFSGIRLVEQQCLQKTVH